MLFFAIVARRKNASGLEPMRHPLPFANTPEFCAALGLFYATWIRTELAIDCAMWKALAPETAEHAHERSARTKFSGRCEHFRILLDAGKFKNGDKVKELLDRIEHHSMRNVFAHSFMASDEHSVTFIHRKMESKQYRLRAYRAAREDFFDHVHDFVRLSFEFEQAAGLSDKEVGDFGAMAIPLAAAQQDATSTTSPTP